MTGVFTIQVHAHVTIVAEDEEEARKKFEENDFEFDDIEFNDDFIVWSDDE